MLEKFGCIPECIPAAGGSRRGFLAFDKNEITAHAREKKCVRMITVGQRRQIIQLRTTVVLIPRARRFSKEKNTGFKQSSHIVWINRKTHLFRKYSFFLRQLFQDFWGVRSAGGVCDRQLAHQLAEDSKDLESFLRHLAQVLVLSLKVKVSDHLSEK